MGVIILSLCTKSELPVDGVNLETFQFLHAFLYFTLANSITGNFNFFFLMLLKIHSIDHHVSNSLFFKHAS